MGWIQHVMGWDTVTGPYYSFWSGSGGVLAGVVLTWVGVGAVAWWGLSCRRAWWCPLIGRHEWQDPATGVTRKLCVVHHPRVDRKNITGGALARLRAEKHLYLGDRPGRG